MLKINQRASGLRFTSLGSGGTNGETKRPCRFSVHTPLSCWKWNKTYEKSGSVTILPNECHVCFITVFALEKTHTQTKEITTNIISKCLIRHAQ